jgi:hypothetical protein
MTSTLATLCFRVNRKIVPFSPTRPVAAVATAMLWGQIIFSVTLSRKSAEKNLNYWVRGLKL